MNGFPAPRRLRLALLDDHDVVRRGTAFHLGNDSRFEIVASHSDSQAFVQALQQRHADVAIIDITLAPGDISGTELVEHLRQALPRVTLLGLPDRPRWRSSITCWMPESAALSANPSR